jgi:hypothetical protein
MTADGVLVCSFLPSAEDGRTPTELDNFVELLPLAGGGAGSLATHAPPGGGTADSFGWMVEPGVYAGGQPIPEASQGQNKWTARVSLHGIVEAHAPRHMAVEVVCI